MKKILFIMATIVAFVLAGCESHNIWDDGPPEMEHVYYVCFHKTNIQTDFLSYEVAQNGNARWRFGANATAGTWTTTDEQWVATVPFQFHSERVRTYNTVIYFWITNDGTSALTAGTDYTVTLENGSALTPDANGAYSLTWAQTKKGIQNVKIKRSATSPNGVLKVNVLNPANGTPNASDLSTTVNNQTAEYEVRGFTMDYNKTTITFTN
ncbi:MAG: hypothetical protein LBE91_16780 [Tannerella sp.]|jgi:hypothetical protein|nr:hypothetical protein [Tannerella sp.]